MTPSLAMNILVIIAVAAAVSYLLIRPVTKRIAARLEELIPEPGDTGRTDDYRQLAELCHALHERMRQLEQRQDFVEHLLTGAGSHPAPVTAENGTSTAEP